MEIQLKRLRKEAGYKSRRDLAVALGEGFTERRITSWENGERMMSLEQACTVADLLECSLDELAGRQWVPQASAADDNHREIVSSYDSLSDEGREVAVNVVGALATSYPRPSPEKLGGGASMPSPNAPA